MKLQSIMFIAFWAVMLTMVGGVFGIDPVSSLVAGTAVGGLLSFVPMPAGILGTNPAFTEKETAFLSAVQKQMEEAMTEKLKGTLTEEQFTEKMEALKTGLAEKELKALKDDLIKDMGTKFDDMQKQLDEAGTELTKLKEGGSPAKHKTIADVFEKALGAEELKGYLENPVGTSKSMELDLKAVVDVTGFTGDVVTPGRVGPEVSFVPPKQFDVRDVMATGTSDVDSIDHIKESGLVDANGFLAENASSAESDLNLEQVKTNSTRIATHVNVSKRALRNVSFLRSHLANRFTELMSVKITDSILNGTGAANTFNGFFNNATVFSAGTLAASIDEANTADTIGAAICRQQEITNMNPTAVFMNPKDVFLMTVTKDLQGSYSENSVVVSRVGNQLFINGVMVIPTYHVAADTYLVADLSATATEFLQVEGMTMTIATEHASNAIQNQVTFIFEMEGILPIYKTFAFLKGTISTDKAALETP